MGFQGLSGEAFPGIDSLAFGVAEVVVVSGGPNFCGHMLLRVDNYYFHVSGVYAHPMWMTAQQYPQYLKSNEKIELLRVRRQLKNKVAAKEKLRSLLSEKWLWLIVPNNCADFVEEVIGAGEDDFALMSNCPTQLEIKLQQEARRARMKMTRRGYRPVNP